MMEGDDDSDLFKGIYPLPKKHSTKTRLFPLTEPPEPSMAAEFRNVDQWQQNSGMLIRSVSLQNYSVELNLADWLNANSLPVELEDPVK